MNCPKCGSTESGVDFCTQCGTPLRSAQSGASGVAPASSMVVVTGFVLALVGLLFFPIPLGVAAIILGSISRSRGAKGMATAALVIGIIDVVVGVLLFATIGRFI
jgi:hypothetical protein